MPSREPIPVYVNVPSIDGMTEMRKIEIAEGVPKMVASHVVGRGGCDCQGFKHRMACRHLDMLSGLKAAVPRSIARAAISEVASEWSRHMRGISILDMQTVDEHGDRVIHVVLGVRSTAPPAFGVGVKSVSGIHRNLSFEIRFSI